MGGSETNACEMKVDNACDPWLHVLAFLLHFFGSACKTRRRRGIDTGIGLPHHLCDTFIGIWSSLFVSARRSNHNLLFRHFSQGRPSADPTAATRVVPPGTDHSLSQENRRFAVSRSESAFVHTKVGYGLRRFGRSF